MKITSKETNTAKAEVTFPCYRQWKSITSPLDRTVVLFCDKTSGVIVLPSPNRLLRGDKEGYFSTEWATVNCEFWKPWHGSVTFEG